MKLDANESRILKVISKLSRGRRLTFHQFTELGGKYGFIKYVNYRLFSIYNTYVSADVNWDTLELDPRKIDTLINKIQFVKDNPNNVIKVFDLDDDFIYNHIDFTRSGIEFTFNYEDREVTEKMLGIDGHQYLLYQQATGYGGEGGYRPDEYDDGEYSIINIFDDKNKELLSTILSYIGEQLLANKLMNSKNDNEELYNEIGSVFNEKLDSAEIFSDITGEWANLVQYSSQESIEEEFERHIKGIIFYNLEDFMVPYDFMIEYLEKNPEVQSFEQMKDVPLIDDDLYLEDAYFSYDINYVELNNYINNILDNTIIELESDLEDGDSSISKRTKNIDQFNKILKDLKFNKNENKELFYVRTPTKMIKINYKDIDYLNGVVNLTVTQIGQPRLNTPPKQHKIPFDDISNYVLSKELFERIIKLLGSINEN